MSWGAGPRAVQFLILGGKARALLQGRTHVTCEDVQALAKPVLRHRLVLSFTAESEGVTPDQLIERIVAITPTREDELRPQRFRKRLPIGACCAMPAAGRLYSMNDSKRFLLPEAIKRIARLDLRARHVVEGFLSGLHRSPYFGQSIEFRQHREYTYGDDPRYVDWKVWAKQDRYYVKQFEEDTNLRCALLCDVSASMRYGRGAMNKYEYACTIAVSLAYLLLRQQDAVGCVAFDDVRPHDRPHAHQAEPPGLDHPGPGAEQPARQDGHLPHPPQRGRELSAAGTDGAGLRPAGGAGGAVPRTAAAAEPRATT